MENVDIISDVIDVKQTHFETDFIRKKYLFTLFVKIWIYSFLQIVLKLVCFEYVPS